MAIIGAGAGTGYPAALDTVQTEIASPSPNKTLMTAGGTNDERAAILAIETALGTTPQGSKTDVKTFLQTEHNADGTHNIPGMSAVSAYLAADQFGIGSDGLPHIVLYDTENYDDLNEFDVTTNKGRFTATKAGVYIITVTIQANYALIGNGGIFKNGSMIWLLPVTDSPIVRFFSYQVKLAANDYIEIKSGCGSSTYKLFGSTGTQQVNSIGIVRVK